MKLKEFNGNIKISPKQEFMKRKVELSRRGSFHLDRSFWINDGEFWEMTTDLYYSRLFKSPLIPMKVKI